MNSIKKIKIAIVIVMLSFAIIQIIHAEEYKKTIYLGLPGDAFARYIDGKPVGIIAEAMADILNDMGYGIKYILLSPEIIKQKIKSGEIDAAASILKKDPLEKEFLITDSIFREHSVFMVKSPKAFQIDKKSDLYNKRIGARKGLSYPLIDGDPQIKLELVKTDAENIRKLLLGKLDIVIVGAISDFYLRLEGMMKDFEIMDRSVGFGDFCGAFSKATFTIKDVETFNTMLFQLKQSQKWKDILNNNGASDLVKNWQFIKE